MNLSRRATTLVLAALFVLWLISNVSVFSTGTVARLRNPAIQLSGLLAVGSAAIGLILALRLRIAERAFDGLDKVYRSHRAFGIAALAFAVVHWLLTQAPGWFATEHGHGGHGPRRGGEVATTGLQHWLQAQHGLAMTFGNWGFYALVALILVALLTRIPYRFFYLSHRLVPLVFLFLAFHSLVLFNREQWLSPVGAVLAMLLVIGVISVLVSLSGLIGARRRARGQVAELKYYPGLKVLQAEVDIVSEWPGHRPGQFAFVEGGRWEGQHPFTIASDWHPAERRITFVAKELGDFTASLKDRARVGAPVEIEGPYGSFTFADERPVQIWIAGGVGITPFIAIMRARQREPGADRRPAHLFFTSENYDEDGLAKLLELAKAAAVHCHFLHTPRDGFLTGERVRTDVPEWREASIWFCGPAPFGEAISKDFIANGFSPARFHQELFAWR